MAELRVPEVYVQSSLYEVLKDIHSGKIHNEDVWVEFGSKEVRYHADSNGLSSDIPQYRASVSDAAKELELQSPDLGLTHVRFGDRITDLKQWQRVTCGAVFGTKLLVGNDSGKLSILDVTNPELDAALGGHALHTSVAQFFPSGRVALSAGMDYAIKIWDLESETEVQTLKHQRGLVEDVALISRGRNLLSLCPSDPDASVTLWEVGTPQVVHSYAVPNARSLSIWSHGTEAQPDDAPLFSIGGTVSLVGTDNEILVLDIRQPNLSARLLGTGSSSLAASGNRLSYAHANQVCGVDLRMPDQTLFKMVAGSSTPFSQVFSTSSKAYAKTDSGVYAYSFQSGIVEVLCSSPVGVLTGYKDELWTIGIEARHFPL